MIQFDFDWSDTLSLVILAGAIALLPLQVWLLVFRKRGLNGRRAGYLKIGLNLLLWLVILGFVLQPYYNRPVASRTGIVAGKEVPETVARKLTDSLPNSRIISPKNLGDTSFDTLILLGQELSPLTFSSMQQNVQRPFVKWLPYFQPDQLRQIQWKAVVSEGQIQVIRGSIASSKKQVLNISFGSNTLDSTVLNSGINDFKLSFPAFARGRTALTLNLNNRTIDTLRFFARPNSPLNVLFALDSPDFETRNLAAWLGKNGHAVQYDATISKNLKSSVKINGPGAADLIITAPGNAGNAAIRKAVAGGKSILFMGFQDPSAEIPLVNNALGTAFRARRIANETFVKILPELSALPYAFAPSGKHLQVPVYPVAVEKRSGKVAISLLNETFPLQLAGDSITYGKIWHSILAYLRPAPGNNLDIPAPVIAGVKSEVDLNNFRENKGMIKWGIDTLYTVNSPFNEKSGSSVFAPSQVGWISIGDSLETEIFVENRSKSDKSVRVKEFVNAYQKQFANLKQENKQVKNATSRLPDWFWFVILIVCFTALWVEAKFF